LPAVVEASKRHKARDSAPDRGVFQFAETVEESVWQDPTKTNEMRVNISQSTSSVIHLIY
jgi:hypothetical protein